VPDATDRGEEWVDFEVSSTLSSAGGLIAIVVESDNDSCSIRSGSDYATGQGYAKGAGGTDAWEFLDHDLMFKVLVGE
jgi:hypothetical protein